MSEVHKIVRAFRPGDIVFIECDGKLSRAEVEAIREQIDAYVPELKIIVLAAGMRVAGREEIEQSAQD